MAVPNPVRPQDQDNRVIPLRPRLRKLRLVPGVQDLPGQPPEVAPLPAHASCNTSESDEAYRHRMVVNFVAMLVTGLLIISGVCLAMIVAHA